MIAVKENQPKLHQKIQDIILEQNPMDWGYTLEKSRGRIEERTVMLYDSFGINKADWKGLAQVIHVIREVKHSKGNSSRQDAYYIESTGKTA